MITRVGKNDVPEFYLPYVELIPEEEELIRYLEHQKARVKLLFDAMDSSKQMYRYAEGKWTPKQVLHHVCDMERVFQYRALCFARNEKAALPGADENQYESEADSNRLSVETIIHDFETIRSSTLCLLRTIKPESWDNTGVANGKPFVLRALPFIIAGHTEHHLKIIQERYL